MSKIILTSSLLLSSVIAFAGAPATPIDGGISLLLVAAGAYGVKKVYDHKKEN